MGSDLGPSLLGEAELHGLVDGHIEVERRGDVLRRLAASPRDRAFVEAWQEQGDMIRAAFRDVACETLPVVLDLASPRLRCIDGARSRTDTAPDDPLITDRRASDAVPDHRKSGLAAAATLIVVAVGLVGTWLMIAQAGRGSEGRESASSRTLETTLASRAAAAVNARAETAPATASSGGLPTVRIPDLTNVGLSLTGVSSQPTEPASIVFRYSDGADAQVAVSVARLPGDALPSRPAAIGRSFAWRRHDAAFAIAGTLPTDRLRAIAATLQDDAAP